MFLYRFEHFDSIAVVQEKKKKKKIKAAVVTHSVEVSVRVQAVFIAFLLYLSISGI